MDSSSVSNLWNYLNSWTTKKGAVLGPIVHRCDLKRLFHIHDTPWCQGAIIEGLVVLYQRSNNKYWIKEAIRLADCQVARISSDGSYKWAGHEDDRYSSLVHNSLANISLLAIIELLEKKNIYTSKSKVYLSTVEQNIRKYLLKQLYNSEIGGFIMNPPKKNIRHDNTSRFIINMNCVTAEMLARFDELNKKEDFSKIVKNISEKVLKYQSKNGSDIGAFDYSNVQPHESILLYTGLALRAFPYLYKISKDDRIIEAAKSAIEHLLNNLDAETSLWYHKYGEQKLYKYPIFISGAGMICNGILEASKITGQNIDFTKQLSTFHDFQLKNGGICNYEGYNHYDNGRYRESGSLCWEDVVPTPNWNAQTFLFLSKVENIQKSSVLTKNSKSARNFILKRNFLYFENKKIFFVFSISPIKSMILMFYLKNIRYGFIIPFYKIIYLLYKITIQRIKK